MKRLASVLLLASAMAACGGGPPTTPAALPTGTTEGTPGGSPVPAGTPAAIATIVDVSKQLTVTSRNYVGQSVTIPPGGPVSALRFNWWTYKSGADQAARNESPAAFGTLYLLTQEYLGSPLALSAATPGFVARSQSIVDGQYVFDNAVTLTAGKTYWFYTDAGGAFVSSFNVSSYPGGDMYNTGQTDPIAPPQPYRKSVASWLLQPNGTYLIPPPGTYQDADFRLQGSR